MEKDKKALRYKGLVDTWTSVLLKEKEEQLKQAAELIGKEDKEFLLKY